MSRFSRRAQAAASGNTSAPTGPNLLIGKVFTSDVADSGTESGPIALASDQNTNTRWISQPSSPVNITADLSGVYDLSRLVITFAADTIRNYTVSVSTNGSSYTQIASGITDNTTRQTITITSFSGTPKGRYLRITGTDRWNVSWGNSIWEVEAYGTLDSSFPVGSVSSFSGTVISNTQVNLTWGYSGSTLTNYTLRRGGTVIASPAAGATSYNDTGLTAGTTYTYTLTGNFSAGGTTNTASVSKTTTGGSSLPSKLVGAYWQMYQGPTVAEVTSSAPEYNIQYAAFALGNGGGGTATFNPVFQSAASFKTDMAASKAQGCKWLISIGGGVPVGSQVFIRNQTEANQLVASLKNIVDEYGFQGVDFDLENGPSGWSPQYMTSVATQLKAHYGNQFIISIVPRPYEGFYYDTAVMMGSACDLVQLQFYDNPSTSNTTWLRQWIRDKVNEIVNNYGIPASKIVIGCITYYPEYGNGSNTVAVYRDAFLELEAIYPDLRGVFIWESSLDKLKAWNFAKTMGPVVLS